MIGDERVTIPADFLTVEEHHLVSVLGQVYGQFCKIVGNGPSRSGDLAEIVHHVHALQNAVLSQAAARAYASTYRLMGETLRETES